MGLAFDQLFGKISSGTDAVVRTEAPYTATEGVGTSRGPIAASVLDQVRAVDGVRAAEGAVSGYALLTDNDGKAITTNGGAPTNGYSMPADEELARRRRAARPGDAPTSAARGRHRRHQRRGARHRARLDHQGPVPGPDPGVHRRRHRRLRRRDKDLGGTTSAYFDTDDRAAGARHAGHVRRDRRAAPTTASAQAELAERLDAVLPDGTEAVTGATVAKENADAIKEDFKFVGIMFGTFAGIALFVGSFIIWNTFTMIVTQRSREIALLRAIGATPAPGDGQPARSRPSLLGVAGIGGRRRARGRRSPRGSRP